jgi:hypothetical protein
MIDSFVVVPADLDGWSIISVAASYGNAVSSSSADLEIQLRDNNFAVSSQIQYTHPLGTREYLFSPSPMIVQDGYTLMVNVQQGGTPPDNEAAGYTVTLTLELI